MDFTFTGEQELLRQSARRFLEKECGISLIKEVAEGDALPGPRLWQRMAELGWTGILIQEEHGGMGLTFVDLAVILEEMGRALLPSPFTSTVVLFGEAMRLAGSDDQRREWLPKIASGEIKGTVAWAEPETLYDLERMGSRAMPSGDSIVLEGAKLFVTDACEADLILFAAKGQEGPCLVLVQPGKDDVRVTPLMAVDKTAELSEVTVAGARVGADALLGRAWDASGVLHQLMNRVNAAYALDMVGGGQRALETAVEYAKTRVQFGRPIGAFQAIKHKCADCLVDVEGARSIAYYAAWAQNNGEREATLSASAAKVFCTEMYRKATKEVMQILGAVGFSWEHEIHFFLKRAKRLGSLFGDVAFHQERLARELGY
ncbi:MAG: acyl-CoA dehydrogenase family protein [Thermodesulfobacteriota bacterium]